MSPLDTILVSVINIDEANNTISFISWNNKSPNDIKQAYKT